MTTQQKKTPMLALAAVVAVGSLLAAADILTELGVTQEEADNTTFQALWSGNAPALSSVAGVVRRMSPEARATAITAVAAAARAYAESDAFRERYALQRRTARPPDLARTTIDTAAQVDKQTAEAAKAIADAKAAMAEMPPEMRKMVEAMMKQSGAAGDIGSLMAEQDAAVKASAAERKAAIKKTEASVADNQRALEEFDAAYPANPERLVARRLQEFLDYSATVPASAVLVPRGGKMIFADPMLEQKPDTWKLLYRAGKPARDAARAAATAWLQALEAGQ